MNARWPSTIALACLSFAVGCHDARALVRPSALADEKPSREHVAEPWRVHVASYNVFYGNAEVVGADPTRWADVPTVERAASLGADVLALQETNDAWEGALRPALATTLPHCRFHAPKRLLPEGTGLCARYPIVEDELLPSTVGWFPAQRTVVETPRGRLQILNVHLKPAVAGEADWWSTHHATRSERDREMRAFLAALEPGVPTIVTGDFNDVIEGDVFRSLDVAGYASAFVELPTDSVSWRWVGAEPPLEALLDHIAFDRASFELLEADVVEGGRSDHLAVRATFALDGKP